MKKSILLWSCLILTHTFSAQESIDDLLAAGISDAQNFTSDYIAPATEGVAYAMNGGWFNNASTFKQFGIELSLIGNASLIKDEKKSFDLIPANYENIRFEDGSTSKMVATALGANDPDITVIVTYDDPIFGNQEVELTLPTGIGSEGLSLIPSAYLQGSFSPLRGTQVKARYFPKINTDDVDVSFYGFGIQQDFTSLIPVRRLLPFAISGMVAYTHLDGSFDFTETGIVEGENQRINTEVNTWLFQLIAGTKLNIINFYGAVGYISGNSTTDLLGTYRVSNGVLTSDEIKDPFSVDSKPSGITATIGTTLKLGFFGFNAAYNIGEFDTVSVGLNFGIRN
ncbi:MAG: hypothetical protein EX254_05530 [Flavobacteriaceae bacterium]|nr:MAG: hypothetical protein EX254_05530 [Flavobacteriaceae bacterium]